MSQLTQLTGDVSLKKGAGKNWSTVARL